jgi:hypothetical protein
MIFDIYIYRKIFLQSRFMLPYLIKNIKLTRNRLRLKLVTPNTIRQDIIISNLLTKNIDKL